MAELIKDKGLEAYIDDPIYNFGEVGASDTIEYSFAFKTGGDVIEYVEKGCGCTSAYWDEENNAIAGSLDMARAAPAKGYSEGRTTVTKYVFVWLNDGRDRFTSDDKKQKVQNPDKEWFRLQLVGTVIV
jgi:hypothetical protein